MKRIAHLIGASEVMHADQPQFVLTFQMLNGEQVRIPVRKDEAAEFQKTVTVEKDGKQVPEVVFDRDRAYEIAFAAAPEAQVGEAAQEEQTSTAASAVAPVAGDGEDNAAGNAAAPAASAPADEAADTAKAS